MSSSKKSYLKPPMNYIQIKENIVHVYADEFQRNRFQIVVAGDPNVGKSTYLKLMKSNEFDPTRHTTTSMDVVVIYVQILDSLRHAKMVFFDMVGQDINRPDELEPLIGRSDAVLAFFDATDETTFESLKRWKQRLDKTIGKGEYQLFVVCNKIDLLEDEGEALIQRIETWKQRAKDELSATRFVLISAKSGDNCHELCYELAETIFAMRDCIDRTERLTGKTNERMLLRDIPAISKHAVYLDSLGNNQSKWWKFKWCLLL